MGTLGSVRMGLNLGGILALSHYSPKVPLLPVADNEIMQIPENYHQTVKEILVQEDLLLFIVFKMLV